MPILEALVGSTSSDLYEAIFDVEITREFDLFEYSDDVRKSPRREVFTPRGSPRLQISRNLPPVAMPATPTDMVSGVELKLFEPRPPQTEIFTASLEAAKRVEDLIQGLPVQRLKDEMKELQDRQARIENLLLMLTRGMRNEIGHSGRHDTMP